MQKQKSRTQTNWILPNESFPLYQLERRKLKWASTPEKARRSLLWIFFPPIIALIILWFVFIYRDSFFQSWNYWHWGYLYIIFLASMTLLSGLLDFASMVVTFSSMRNEQVFSRLDLLALATEKENITRSKHAFAKLRITRFLVFNLAVRVAVLLMLGLLFLLSGYFFGYWSTLLEPWHEFVYNIREYPLISIAVGIGGTLVFAFYLLEPIWRVNAITAMGIALSARIKNIALLAPMAFFILAIMWILQGIVLGFTTFVMWSFIMGISISNTSIPQWLDFIGLLIALLIYLTVAYGFYYIIRNIAYGRIYARIP